MNINTHTIENGIKKQICIAFIIKVFMFNPGILTINAGIANVALSLIDISIIFVIIPIKNILNIKTQLLKTN